jgi:hypothetical protein
VQSSGANPNTIQSSTTLDKTKAYLSNMSPLCRVVYDAKKHQLIVGINKYPYLTISIDIAAKLGVFLFVCLFVCFLFVIFCLLLFVVLKITLL